MMQIASADPGSDLAQLWPDYRPTPLTELPPLARLAGVASVLVKIEGERPLGNFKVLGGMLAGLRALARATGAPSISALLSSNTPRSLPRLICASDGNHGLAVAAAAQRAGARASIYLPVGVARSRAERIAAVGGDIVWVDGTYDHAVSEAAAAAARGEGLLIADTSDDPDDPVVRDVMSGYGLIAGELIVQIEEARKEFPSHLFVQAGVGGLAAAMADGLRPFMREPKGLVIAEPAAAACVAAGLAAGRPVPIAGDLHTAAEMLSCGLASASALRVLLRHDARSVALAEDELHAAVRALCEAGGPPTTPSGATGLAGLLHVAASPALRAEHQLDADSTVLLVISEGGVVEREGLEPSTPAL